MRSYLFTALAFSVSLVACGDDDSGTNCGPGTVEQNGQCVLASDTNTPPQDTLLQDTNTTNNPNDTNTNPGDTNVQVDTLPADTNGECTPAEADQGFVGAPCTKNCQCQQNVNGKALICYQGFYMQGFGFCTDYADTRTPANDLQEGDGVETVQFSSDCFPDVPANVRTRPLYAKACNTLEDCKAVGAAYTHCGTGGGDFPWAPGGRGTYCPTSTGSNRTLTTNNTCIIANVPPFDGSYVD